MDPGLALRDVFLRSLAAVTRRVHPRGTERVLRLLHDPERVARAGTGWHRPIESVVRMPNGCQLLTNTGSFVEWFVFFKGDYEHEMTQLLKQLLRVGDIAIDVGANIGVHTLTMSRAVGTTGVVIACEPHPRLVERLRSNLRLNAAQNVRVEPIAASDKSGTVQFFIADPSTSNQMVSSLHAEADPALLAKPLMVESQSLDRLSESLGRRVSLIKIDVEGAEPMVLRGAASLLRRDRPSVIFEYCRPKWEPAGFKLETVLDELGKLGYSRFESLGSAGLVPLHPPATEYANILASS